MVRSFESGICISTQHNHPLVSHKTYFLKQFGSSGTFSKNLFWNRKWGQKKVPLILQWNNRTWSLLDLISISTFPLSVNPRLSFPTLKSLWPMSAKCLTSTMESPVSPSAPLLLLFFCPCRALTSLMKTHKTSQLLVFPESSHEEEWAGELSSAGPRQRALQTRCFAPLCLGSAIIPRTWTWLLSFCKFPEWNGYRYFDWTPS